VVRILWPVEVQEAGSPRRKGEEDAIAVFRGYVPEFSWFRGVVQGFEENGLDEFIANEELVVRCDLVRVECGDRLSLHEPGERVQTRGESWTNPAIHPARPLSRKRPPGPKFGLKLSKAIRIGGSHSLKNTQRLG
jgi:hypothetical protein